jgi:hypothetical protein
MKAFYRPILAAGRTAIPRPSIEYETMERGVSWQCHTGVSNACEYGALHVLSVVSRMVSGRLETPPYLKCGESASFLAHVTFNIHPTFAQSRSGRRAESSRNGGTNG